MNDQECLEALDQKLLTARIVGCDRRAPDEIREQFDFRLCCKVTHRVRDATNYFSKILRIVSQRTPLQ